MTTTTATPKLNMTRGIPGSVMGWMVAWGVWPTDHETKTTASAGVWLPTATGRALHLVAPGTYNYDDPSDLRAQSCCRSGAANVKLIFKDPVSAGEVVVRGSYLSSEDALGAWAKVAAALSAYRILAGSAPFDEQDGYRSVVRAFDVVSRVARNEIDRTALVGLGPRWQAMPEEGRYLLPWLIMAAANGIDRCCERCADHGTGRSQTRHWG